MLKFLTSFGASTFFQKNRLLATAKTLQAPEQHILKKILNTFHGQDEETRSQIAFATIVKKIQTSDYNDSWIYLFKNLIILDRVLGDMCFVEEIAFLQLSVINTFVERSSKYSELRTAQLVKRYWKLIKFTGKLLLTKKHILCYPRSQRAEFLQTLSAQQILQQIQTLEKLFFLCFSIVEIFQPPQNYRQPLKNSFANLQKTKLIEYLYLQIIYRLYRYYSSQLLCVNQLFHFVSKDANLGILSMAELKKFRISLKKFKQNATFFINFAEKNKHIKGFQIVNYRELDPMRESDLIKAIDTYINEKMKSDQMGSSVKDYISGQKIMISVHLNKKMSENLEKNNPSQRKTITVKREGESGSGRNNPFSNWISSYSQDFPQKQIMTLDLIMLLKEEEKKKQVEDIEICMDRETIFLDERDREMVFRKPEDINFKSEFKNIYSDLESTWSN